MGQMDVLEHVAVRCRETATGCLEWTLYRQPNGYASMKYEGKTRLVHRLVYAAVRGPIPAGLEIDHLCRNRACQNVEHMRVVTHGENMVGAIQPVTRTRTETHCPSGHAYDEANTYRLNGHRYCRECNRLSKASSRLRRRREHARSASPGEADVASRSLQ